MISGSPFLGSVQMIESTLSGVTFGLPVSEVLFVFFFNLYIECLLHFLYVNLNAVYIFYQLLASNLSHLKRSSIKINHNIT